MGAQDDAEVLDPATPEAWHAWLEQHHDTSPGVWVVVSRRPDDTRAVPYDDAVREALCWGWVDGLTRRGADGRSTIWFTRRSPRSAWALSNRRRVAELEAQGRMQPAGRAVVDEARRSGRWSVLEGPEALVEPPELAAALDAEPAARAGWDASPPSSRKQALTTLALAVREETRLRHVERIVALLVAGRRPA